MQKIPGGHGPRSQDSSASGSSYGTLFATTTTKPASPRAELDPSEPLDAASDASAAATDVAAPCVAAGEPETEGHAGAGDGGVSDSASFISAAGASQSAARSAVASQAAAGGSGTAAQSPYASRAPPSFRNYLNQGVQSDIEAPAQADPAHLMPAAVATASSACTAPATMVDLKPSAVDLLPFSESADISRVQTNSVWAMSNAIFASRVDSAEAAARPAAAAGVPGTDASAFMSTEGSVPPLTPLNSAVNLPQLNQVTSPILEAESAAVWATANLQQEPSLAVSAAAALSATSVMSEVSVGVSAPSVITSDGESSPEWVSPRPRRIFLSRKVLDASAAINDSSMPGALDSVSGSQRPPESSLVGSAGGSTGAGGETQAQSQVSSPPKHSAATDAASGSMEQSPWVASTGADAACCGTWLCRVPCCCKVSKPVVAACNHRNAATC